MATATTPKKTKPKNALQAFKERNRKEPTLAQIKKELTYWKRYARSLEEELKKYPAK